MHLKLQNVYVGAPSQTPWSDAHLQFYNRSYMGITTHQQWNKGRPSNFMMWAKRIFSKKKNTFSILCLLNIIFKFRGLQKIGLALWRWSATRFHLSAGPVNNPPTNWQHEKLCRVRFKNFNLNKKLYVWLQSIKNLKCINNHINTTNLDKIK